MLNGDGSENDKKPSMSNRKNKTTLHLQHTFFVHFFAVVVGRA